MKMKSRNRIKTILKRLGLYALATVLAAGSAPYMSVFTVYAQDEVQDENGENQDNTETIYIYDKK